MRSEGDASDPGPGHGASTGLAGVIAGAHEQRAAELLGLRDRIEALLLVMRVVKEVKAFTFFAQSGESGGGPMRRVPVARWVAREQPEAVRERPV